MQDSLMMIEQSVLGGMLLDSAQINPVIDLIDESNFTNKVNREIFLGVKKLHELGKVVDIIMLESLLQPTMPDFNVFLYVAELVRNTPAANNTVPYAASLKDLATRKQLSKAFDKLEKCTHLPIPTQELMQMAESELKTLNVTTTEVTTSIQTALRAYYDVLESIIDGSGPKKINTGYGDLDAILGGMRPGNLIVIGARPSIGKTTFSLNILRNIMLTNPKPVLFCSLEMQSVELVRSLLAMTGSISVDMLKDEKICDLNDNRLAYANSQIATWNLELANSTSKWTDLKQLIRNFKKNNPECQLVVIDYLGLIIGEPAENKVIEISNTTRDLKLLANEIETPIIVLSQLNRESEKKPTNHPPQLHDLRGSGSIEQDADTVIFIHREDKTVPRTQVIVAKNRAGPCDTAILWFDGKTATFKST